MGSSNEPPIAYRFKAGVSGNPQGRPKGSISKEAITRRVAKTMVKVGEERMSFREAYILKLNQLAAGGNVTIAKLRDELEKILEPQSKDAGVGIVMPYFVEGADWRRIVGKQQAALQLRVEALREKLDGDKKSPQR
jgi:hypothetical protein